MKGITENSQPGDARRQGSRLEGKDLIGYNSHLIGNKDLFPEPYDKPFHAFSEFLKPDISMYYLGGDIVESNNRPGDQLREQGNIESYIDRIALNGGITAVDIDHIGHGLKCEERDTDG